MLIMKLTKKQQLALQDVLDLGDIFDITTHDIGVDDIGAICMTVDVTNCDDKDVDIYRFYSDGKVDRYLSGGFGASNVYDIVF